MRSVSQFSPRYIDINSAIKEKDFEIHRLKEELSRLKIQQKIVNKILDMPDEGKQSYDKIKKNDSEIQINLQQQKDFESDMSLKLNESSPPLEKMPIYQKIDSFQIHEKSLIFSSKNKKSGSIKDDSFILKNNDSIQLVNYHPSEIILEEDLSSTKKDSKPKFIIKLNDLQKNLNKKV